MEALYEDIRKDAELAVAMAVARANGALDYSFDSFAVVDAMLREARRSAASMQEEGRQGLIAAFGCYLLETARRNAGGVYYWFEQENMPVLVVGEPQFHIAVGTWWRVRDVLAATHDDGVAAFMFEFLQKIGVATDGERVLFL